MLKVVKGYEKSTADVILARELQKKWRSSMGYDMSLIVLKKKVWEEAQRQDPEMDFAELYHKYLWMNLYPEEYSVHPEHENRYICSESKRLFDGFFEQEGIKVSNDGVVALTEAKYRKLTAWLKFKLSTELLIDIVDEIEYWVLLCKVYKKLVSAQIDFNTEVVVFSHDW